MRCQYIVLYAILLQNLQKQTYCTAPCPNMAVKKQSKTTFYKF